MTGREAFRAFAVICGGVLLGWFLAGCSEPPAPPAMPVTLPIEVPFKLTVCHVGPEFDKTERAHLQNAATAWAMLSDYRATISTPADLNFNDVGTLAPCTVMKLQEHNRLVMKVDAYFSHGGVKVKAFTISQRVYFIEGRYKPQEFPWMAMHEFGHVLGLDDIEESGHVMSREHSHGKWFDRSDVKECKRALVCP